MTGSPLRSRFVAAESWSRGGKSVRAIVVHMAEGGGTVSWLTHPDGNSSHYVLEYDGDIVQMVDEDRAAGSINPQRLRTTDDAPFSFLGESIRFGVTAARKALGAWWPDPNACVIAIEVEGFAATGPNAAQRPRLKALIADIRKRHGSLPALGHRDFQSYKACPGHRIAWLDFGGHGVAANAPAPAPAPEPAPMATKGSTVPEVPTRLWLKPDPAVATRSRWLYVYSDHRPDAGNRQLEPIRPLLLTRFIDADTYAVAYEGTTADANATSTEMFVKSVDVAKTEPVPLNDPARERTAYNAGLSAAEAAVHALPRR